MDDSYVISTPENVEIAFTPAGLATRFLAAVIDTLILGVLLFSVLMAGLTAAAAADALGDVAGIAIVAVIVILVFLIFFGYYIFFETVWAGQSPGKRALGLRVIRDDGLPLNFTASVIRNLVRLIDFMPGTYGFGVIAMFLNKRWKRLGDLAAGTLVVLDRGLQAPPRLRLAPPDQLGMEVPQLAYPLPPEEYDLGREYLLRYYSLSGAARESVGRSLADLYEQRTGVARGPAEPWRYITAVLIASGGDQPVSA